MVIKLLNKKMNDIICLANFKQNEYDIIIHTLQM